MRIIIGGFQHETNTFAPTKADYAAFVQGGGLPALAAGQALFDAMVPGANIPCAGFIQAARAAGHTLVPTVWAGASPSAHVTQDAYERIATTIVEGVRAALPADAVYLDLHGAMVTETFDDGEGELLRRVREVVGPTVPVIASLDLHANVTQAMLTHADALVAYRTYPHVDMADTGRTALALLEKRLALGRPFAMASVRIPYLVPICWQCTQTEPAASLYRSLAEIEQASGAISMSYAMGFPAADFPECGQRVWAYASDESVAEHAAQAMADQVLAAERLFDGELLEPQAAVTKALDLVAQGRRPIVIADAQDNPGAGANSDTTGLLRALLAQQVPSAALGLLVDPAAAQAAHAAGEGAQLQLSLGGRSGLPEDAPLLGDWIVERLSDGRLHTTGPYYGQRPLDVGPSACLRRGGVRVVVASHKAQMADQAMFRFVGIEPTAQDILVVKSTVHFRADFAPIAAEILTAIAPGPMAMRSTDWQWQHLPDALRMMPGGPTYAEVKHKHAA